jgi:hypothetical protein
MLRSNIRRDPAARDLIIMASHGRKGITGELVGSETARVITTCTIPVRSIADPPRIACSALGPDAQRGSEDPDELLVLKRL